MKTFKSVIASLLISGVVLAMLCFTPSFKTNGFALVCFEFVTGVGIDDPSEIANPSNWVPITNNVSDINLLMCPGNNYLCGICFEDTQFPGNTPSERINAAFGMLADYIERFGVPSIEGSYIDIDTNISVIKSVAIYKRFIE